MDAAKTPVPGVGTGVLSLLRGCADTDLLMSVWGCSSPSRRVSADGGFPSPRCFISSLVVPPAQAHPLQLVPALLHAPGAGVPQHQPPVADVCSQAQGSQRASWAPAEHPCPWVQSQPPGREPARGSPKSRAVVGRLKPWGPGRAARCGQPCPGRRISLATALGQQQFWLGGACCVQPQWYHAGCAYLGCRVSKTPRCNGFRVLCRPWDVG